MEFYQHTITENSLEWITYYPNINCPQFTPINYYLYIYKNLFGQFNVLGSLIIAEILPLFEDYNIPLAGNDYLLSVNSGDNIANGLDIKKYQNLKTTDPYLLRQKQYWKECVEAFEWLKKQFMLSSVDIDKMIQKEIMERYKYNFDKNDINAYNIFKQFLSETQINRGDATRQLFEKSSNITLQKRMLEYQKVRTRK